MTAYESQNLVNVGPRYRMTREISSRHVLERVVRVVASHDIGGALQGEPCRDGRPAPIGTGVKEPLNCAP